MKGVNKVENHLTTNRHGSLRDRGSADAYYGRPPCPHYFVGATYDSEKITELSKEEIQAYMDAYNSEHDRKEF